MDEDAQPDRGKRNWRYQAVWRSEQSGDRHYTICEIYLDQFDQLTNWTENAEHTPIGNDVADLLNELVRMYVDAACWEAVPFDGLRVGMTFKKAISQEQREGIAQMFDVLSIATAPRAEPPREGGTE